MLALAGRGAPALAISEPVARACTSCAGYLVARVVQHFEQQRDVSVLVAQVGHELLHAAVKVRVACWHKHSCKGKGRGAGINMHVRLRAEVPQPLALQDACMHTYAHMAASSGNASRCHFYTATAGACGQFRFYVYMFTLRCLGGRRRHGLGPGVHPLEGGLAGAGGLRHRRCWGRGRGHHMLPLQLSQQLGCRGGEKGHVCLGAGRGRAGR